MAKHEFMMLFREGASSMLKVIMVDGLSARFPNCSFETERAPSPDLSDVILPVIRVGGTDDCDGSPADLPGEELRRDVADVFVDMLREAREAKPS